MKNYETIVINLIGGPGVGKSVLAAKIYIDIKTGLRESCEYVKEIAKDFVYREDDDMLNNQHLISNLQYKRFKEKVGKVKYIITDGRLAHGLYYNRYNKDNMSNVEKTEEKIMEYINKFHNINIYLTRNPEIAYETNGRIQTEDESKEIDIILKKILEEKNIEIEDFYSDIKRTNIMLDYIIKKS